MAHLINIAANMASADESDTYYYFVNKMLKAVFISIIQYGLNPGCVLHLPGEIQYIIHADAFCFRSLLKLHIFNDSWSFFECIYTDDSFW